MQTFMPYADFNKVAKCLDYKRLGKQRVEAYQIFKALTQENYGWKNHPIVKMWKGYEEALLEYCLVMIKEWKNRGYKDTMFPIINSIYVDFERQDCNHYPEWIYDKELQLSHQSNLIRKLPEHYRKIFGKHIRDDLPYKWVK